MMVKCRSKQSLIKHTKKRQLNKNNLVFFTARCYAYFGVSICFKKNSTRIPALLHQQYKYKLPDICCLVFTSSVIPNPIFQMVNVNANDIAPRYSNQLSNVTFLFCAVAFCLPYRYNMIVVVTGPSPQSSKNAGLRQHIPRIQTTIAIYPYLI